MPDINLSNPAGRDAVVNMETVSTPLQVRWIDDDGRQARSVRFLKSTLAQDIDVLRELSQAQDVEISDLLMQADPDVDIETAGSFLQDTSRVYVNPKNEILHRALQYDVIKNPDGSERERRVTERTTPNVSSEIPLAWSGIYMKKSEAISKFVFANKLQLTHVNGLTYDFLYEMAKDLEKRDSMLLMGAGPKSNEPLILRRGSVPYRGFLEGRTRGDNYLLLLHLSNMELKTPEAQTKAD